MRFQKIKKNIVRVAAVALIVAVTFAATGCMPWWLNKWQPVQTPTPIAEAVQTEQPQTEEPREESQQLEESSSEAATPGTLEGSKNAIRNNLEDVTVNEFDMEVTFVPEEKAVEIDETLVYHNNTGIPLDEIYFNLYPNAFRADGGGIDVGQIMIGGKELALEEVEDTVFRLALPETLGVDESVSIDMQYTVHVPNINNRFGYYDDTYYMGNFHMIPAVYDDDGWNIDTYVDTGDAFYSDTANYKVRIIAPDGYTVAATGKERDGVYEANLVRDFAFAASDEFQVITDTQDGVEITVYYQDGQQPNAERMMETSKKALRFFSNLLGEYPYDTLAVINTGDLGAGVGGMEYPTLVLSRPSNIMPDEAVEDMDPDEVRYYSYLDTDIPVMHEIGHQWFYNIVGNDQVEEPWLDEGMTSYLEYLYLMEYPYVEEFPALAEEENYLYGTDTIDKYYDDAYGEMVEEGAKITGSLYDFDDGYYAYGRDVYTAPAAMMNMVRNKMGDAEFRQVLRKYVDEFAYLHVTTQEFMDFWQNNSQEDLSGIFNDFI